MSLEQLGAFGEGPNRDSRPASGTAAFAYTLRTVATFSLQIGSGFVLHIRSPREV